MRKTPSPTDTVAITLDPGKVEIMPAPSNQDRYQAIPALKPPLTWNEIKALVGEQIAPEAAQEERE